MKKLIGYIDLILFLVLVTIKTLIYGKFINPYFNAGFIFCPVLASLLIIASISLLFKSKARSRYLYIWNIVISCFLIADINYFRYYKDIISIPVIKNGILLGAVNQAVKTIIKPQDLLLLTDIILIPIIKKIFKFKYSNIYSNYIEIKNSIPKFRVRILYFSVFFILSIFFDGHYINKLNIEQPMLIQGMCNKIYISNVLGNINCHAIDVYNFTKKNIFEKKSIDDETAEDIHNYFKTNSKTTKNKFTNIGKDKNLIMIQVEALQEFVINKKIEGQEITPNLNKWMKRNLYFNNYYYQVAGGNTSDAEFMSNNSLYPASSGAAYYIYSGNEFNSLANLLKPKGYSTAAFHGYKEGFWNRNAMYVKEGFDKFYGEKSFNIDEVIGLGLSDESFFKQSLEKMESLKEPYYSFLVTLTSHFPYEATNKYGTFNVGKYEGTFLGNYLKSIHYTDKQLGMFLNRLEQTGKLDNSIIVLYGDHFAIPKNHDKELYSFVGESKDNEFAWIKYQKVPLMIHFPKDEHKGINNVTAGQMDLYPTLCNMFNISNPYMFGKDMLNDKDKNRTVIFRSGSFIDDKVFFFSSNKKYYDIKSEKQIKETEDLKKKKENVTKQLQYNDLLLDHNLIKKFNSK